MSGPLSNNGNAEEEADVIFTSTVIGFSLTRLLLGQPFQFDVDLGGNPAGQQALPAGHAHAVNCIRACLAGSPYPVNVNFLGAAGTPVNAGGGGAGQMITGRPGGAYLAPHARRAGMLSGPAVNMRHWEHRVAWNQEGTPGQYHGRGAYTGMIDDPVGNHTLVMATRRRVIRDPDRWNPNPGGLWGLIDSSNYGGRTRFAVGQPPQPSANLSADPNVGMGPLNENAGIVQYVHGMSWAMREAIRWGPWCTAFELAVGHQTDKLASCFPCTTYMYAAGFPPSSCHLGRGESWGTLPDGSLYGLGGENHEFSTGAEGEAERAIARSINVRWHSQMYHYLREGAQILHSVRLGAMTPGHQQAIGFLLARLNRQDPVGVTQGGNLFLDAISFHKKDAQRITHAYN